MLHLSVERIGNGHLDKTQASSVTGVETAMFTIRLFILNHMDKGSTARDSDYPNPLANRCCDACERNSILLSIDDVKVPDNAVYLS